MTRDSAAFQMWLSWLKDLGGNFTPVYNNDDPPLPKGRRDPDRKPRRYELDPEKYAVTTKGSVVRL